MNFIQISSSDLLILLIFVDLKEKENALNNKYCVFKYLVRNLFKSLLFLYLFAHICTI